MRLRASGVGLRVRGAARGADRGGGCQVMDTVHNPDLRKQLLAELQWLMPRLHGPLPPLPTRRLACLLDSRLCLDNAHYLL